MIDNILTGISGYILGRRHTARNITQGFPDAGFLTMRRVTLGDESTPLFVQGHTIAAGPDNTTHWEWPYSRGWKVPVARNLDIFKAGDGRLDAMHGAPGLEKIFGIVKDGMLYNARTEAFNDPTRSPGDGSTQLHHIMNEDGFSTVLKTGSYNDPLWDVGVMRLQIKWDGEAHLYRLPNAIIDDIAGVQYAGTVGSGFCHCVRVFKSRVTGKYNYLFVAYWRATSPYSTQYFLYDEDGNFLWKTPDLALGDPGSYTYTYYRVQHVLSTPDEESWYMLVMNQETQQVWALSSDDAGVTWIQELLTDATPDADLEDDWTLASGPGIPAETPVSICMPATLEAGTFQQLAAVNPAVSLADWAPWVPFIDRDIEELTIHDSHGSRQM